MTNNLGKVISLTILIFLQCSYFYSKTNDFRIKVFLNTNNCFACEGDLRELKNLNRNIEIEINIDKAVERELKEYLDKFDLSELNYKVNFLEKIKFDKKHHENSFYQLILNNKVISTFYGDKLRDYIQGLNSISHQQILDFNIMLEDSQTYSKLITVSIDSNIININDYKLGKNFTYKINIAEQKAKKKCVLLSKNFNYSTFFSIGDMDTTFYHQFKEEVIKRGTRPTFDQAFFKSNSLYILLNVPYYYMRTPNVLRSDNRIFILKKDIYTEKTSLLYVKNRNIICKDSTLYFLDNSKNFYVTKNSEIIFPLFTTKYRSNNAYRYMKTFKENDTLKFKEIMNISSDSKFALKYNLDDDIFFSNSNYTYSIKNKFYFDLNNQTMNDDFISTKKDGDVLDIKIDGNFIKFLTLKNKEIKILMYDKITKRLISSYSLTFEKTVLYPSLRFYNSSHVFALTDDGKEFTFKCYNL